MDYNTPNNQSGFIPAKPDNNMLWAILSTVCCCLPFGIVSIVYAAKVNGLYLAKQYDAANQAAEQAKKWAIISAATSIAVNIIYFIFYAFLGLGSLLDF